MPDLSFVRDWEGVFPTREAPAARIGERLAWSVEPSFRETADGWTLAFAPKDIIKTTVLEEMARTRPNTQLRSFKAGHVVHHDDPDGFVAAVRAFLSSSKAETTRAFYSLET